MHQMRAKTCHRVKRYLASSDGRYLERLDPIPKVVNQIPLASYSSTGIIQVNKNKVNGSMTSVKTLMMFWLGRGFSAAEQAGQ